MAGERPTGHNEPDQTPKRTEPKMKLRADLTYLRDTYGLTVSMRRQIQEDDPRVKVEKIGLPEAVRGVRILREEISKYPKGFIQICPIKTVRLVKTLSFDKEANGGLAAEDGTIYIRTDLKTPDWIVRGIIHHEIFHISDRIRVMTPSMGDLIGKLIDMKQTPVDTTFDRNFYLGDLWKTAEPDPDYASVYARKNRIEDRAETAALLMSSPVKAFSRAVKNPAFGKKLDSVQTDFNIRSGGLMDKAYFTDLLKGMVQEGYWQ